MFQHAIESFEHGLEHYLDGSTKSRKFALLHIDHAIELLLKEKVVQQGKTIYKSNGTTLNLHEAFGSLKSVEIPERPRLEELHDLRNVIQHKGLTPDSGSTQFYVEVAYNFVRRFLEEELSTPIEQVLSREHRAFLEGQPLLLEKTDEVVAAFKEAQIAEDPSQRILMGYTALNRAVDILGDPTTGKVLFRRTLRNAAKSLGFSPAVVDPHLNVVMRLRNQVVHSAYEPSEDDADDYIKAVKAILEMIGCEF
jgi:hypothetical protein